MRLHQANHEAGHVGLSDSRNGTHPTASREELVLLEAEEFTPNVLYHVLVQELSTAFHGAQPRSR